MDATTPSPTVRPPAEHARVGLGVILASELALVPVAALVWLVAHGVFRVPFPPLLPEPAWAAALAGTAAGVPLGALAGALMRAPGLRPRFRRLLTALSGFEPTVPALVAVGFAAGLGEEALFRWALVPAIGVWWSSALFAGLHTFGPKRSGLGVVLAVAYVVLAFLASLGLAALYARSGALAAVVAHGAYDAVALVIVRPLLLESRRRG